MLGPRNEIRQRTLSDDDELGATPSSIRNSDEKPSSLKLLHAPIPLIEEDEDEDNEDETSPMPTFPSPGYLYRLY